MFSGGDFAVEVGAAFGGVAELDHRHDVQHPVDLPVAGSGSRWRTWSPEEAAIGAVPFQEAKCARAGNRVMSPASIEQPGSAGRADPLQAGQRRSGGRKQRSQLFVGGLGALAGAPGDR